eukprot:CAMPEP_0115837988 /NCGR_PEP_ID=MMETSP0287-20121206/5498_1 /TAXON_ID=412157 /ORGANISM="Chrysochromulina rotalis, Strain UIO044" /LENGTH=102 /DNA_ID=CAMNT_0003291503 /DNA_START=398 /DNA_END=704 /DNA_ORIENTATION=+
MPMPPSLGQAAPPSRLAAAALRAAGYHQQSAAPTLEIIEKDDAGRARELKADLDAVAHARRRQLRRCLDPLPLRAQAEFVGNAQPAPAITRVEQLNGQTGRR